MQRSRNKRALTPLDPDALNALALSYVARYATTRKKLVDYLRRKLRERGWAGDLEPDLSTIADRFADHGFIDDAAFALARDQALTRRGYGAARVRQALEHAGVLAEWTAPDAHAAFAAAEAFARRRRIGRFAAAEADEKTVRRHAAAMIRAGHAHDLAWKFARERPGEPSKTAE